MSEERHEKDKVVYSGTQHEADERIRGPHQRPERVTSQHDRGPQPEDQEEWVRKYREQQEQEKLAALGKGQDLQEADQPDNEGEARRD